MAYDLECGEGCSTLSEDVSRAFTYVLIYCRVKPFGRNLRIGSTPTAPSRSSAHLSCVARILKLNGVLSAAMIMTLD